MRRVLLVVLASSLAPVLWACGPASPCAGVSGTCVPFTAGKSSESSIASAFATATPGTTLAFGAGTFAFTNTLNLAGANITVKGAGMDQTILDFHGQTGGSEGLYATDHTDTLLLTGFTVRDTPGDAIKIIGSTGVTVRFVKTEWTGTDAHTHGAYGIYPVQCTNVLIENSQAIGASDSGLYIGQSQNIIIRNNVAMQNVAGIEIENSFFADVHDNDAEQNTAGILVFDLPNLQQTGGHNVRVFNNTIKNNNTANFAALGDIVATVPKGTGFFVMANSNVEVFGNTITDNNTVSMAVISYYVTQLAIHDSGYYPFPSLISIHDNTVSGGGTLPDSHSQIGALLLSVQASFAGSVIPAQIYDGVTDPSATGGTANNPMQVCFHNNSTSTFVDLHFDQLNAQGSNLGAIMTTDATAFTCTLPALPAVSF